MLEFILCFSIHTMYGVSPALRSVVLSGALSLSGMEQNENYRGLRVASIQPRRLFSVHWRKRATWLISQLFDSTSAALQQTFGGQNTPVALESGMLPIHLRMHTVSGLRAFRVLPIRTCWCQQPSSGWLGVELVKYSWLRSVRLGSATLSLGEGYMKRSVFIDSTFECKWHTPT